MPKAKSDQPDQPNESYDNMTDAELQQAAQSRGLNPNGTPEEVKARLIEADTAAAEGPAESDR